MHYRTVLYEQGELVNQLITSIGYISIVYPGAQSVTIINKGCDDYDFLSLCEKEDLIVCEHRIMSTITIDIHKIMDNKT